MDGKRDRCVIFIISDTRGARFVIPFKKQKVTKHYWKNSWKDTTKLDMHARTKKINRIVRKDRTHMHTVRIHAKDVLFFKILST